MNIRYFHTEKSINSPALYSVMEQLKDRVTKHTGAYDEHEDFVRLPSDVSLRAEIEHHVQRLYSTRLKFVVLIGIGGSNLGTEAVYRAIRGGDYSDTMHPRLICLDTIEQDYCDEIISHVERSVSHVDEVAIVVVSKSGTTTETVLNAALLIDRLSKKMTALENRIVAITDPGTILEQYANEHGWALLPHPKSIGGRFSVLSVVGLFPLRLLGIDIDSLREGAKEEFHQAVHSIANNNALRTAGVLYSQIHEHKQIWNLFYFAPQLESLGKWSRQLIAESLGKERDRTGKIIHSGILPTVSIGSTDLHSVGQLYFAGPKNTFHTVVTVANPESVSSTKNSLLSLIGAKTLSPTFAIAAIEKGVFVALEKHRIAYQHVTFTHRNAYEVGAYIAWLESVVYYLAQLLHIDPFNQPNVEDYKSVTREIIQKQ